MFARVSGQSYDEDEGDNASSDDDAHENNEEEEEVEDWMMLCRLNQHYEESGNPMFENTTDWFEAAKSVPVEVLRDCPGWIYKKKKEMEEGQQLVMQPEVVVIDPVSLNEKQTLAFNILKSHAQRFATSESLRMIICGTAGTGKTYLINALKQVIGDKSIFTATTGIAAFNIHGQTLHSAAQLPIREIKELQGESLQRLQLKLEGKEYLIIDEMSMIGDKMLSWLDNRLRSVTGFQDTPFWGLWTVASGG